MVDRYAVIGNPVAHSKSPWIHAQFASQTGEQLEYAALLAPVGGFEQTLRDFRQSGGRGANVTLPFKEEACRLAAQLSGRAHVAQAVNTLLFRDNEICGDNTDGCGLIRDLVGNLGFEIAGRRVLLLGAGGAARGVLEPLLHARPSSLTVANRTVEKARLLMESFRDQAANARGSTQTRACGFSDLDGEHFDLVINATSAGLSQARLPIPQRLFSTGSLAYEMMYGRDTAFLRQARAEGAEQTADGLGMLVEQAAESFFLWRGVRPRTAPVLATLRAG